MSALLGHSDAARMMARAFDEEADKIAGRGGAQIAETLFAIGRAYDRAAILMLEENRRQIGATPTTSPNAV